MLGKKRRKLARRLAELCGRREASAFSGFLHAAMAWAVLAALSARRSARAQELGLPFVSDSPVPQNTTTSQLRLKTEGQAQETLGLGILPPNTWPQIQTQIQGYGPEVGSESTRLPNATIAAQAEAEARGVGPEAIAAAAPPPVHLAAAPIDAASPESLDRLISTNTKVNPDGAPNGVPIFDTVPALNLDRTPLLGTLAAAQASPTLRQTPAELKSGDQRFNFRRHRPRNNKIAISTDISNNNRNGNRNNNNNGNGPAEEDREALSRGLDIDVAPFLFPAVGERRKAAAAAAATSQRRCQFVDGTFWPSATLCEDQLGDEPCRGIFGRDHNGNKSRPILCLDPALEKLARKCAKTCKICCEVSKYACTDSAADLIDCTRHRRKCAEPRWRPVMAAACEHTCGLCDADRCFDAAALASSSGGGGGDAAGDGGCETFRPLCRQRAYRRVMRSSCALTCGYCQPSASKMISESLGSENCADKLPSCVFQKRLCNDARYAVLMAEKCARTCRHCGDDIDDETSVQAQKLGGTSRREFRRLSPLAGNESEAGPQSQKSDSAGSGISADSDREDSDQIRVTLSGELIDDGDDSGPRLRQRPFDDFSASSSMDESSENRAVPRTVREDPAGVERQQRPPIRRRNPTGGTRRNGERPQNGTSNSRYEGLTSQETAFIRELEAVDSSSGSTNGNSTDSGEDLFEIFERELQRLIRENNQQINERAQRINQNRRPLATSSEHDVDAEESPDEAKDSSSEEFSDETRNWAPKSLAKRRPSGNKSRENKRNSFSNRRNRGNSTNQRSLNDQLGSDDLNAIEDGRLRRLAALRRLLRDESSAAEKDSAERADNRIDPEGHRRSNGSHYGKSANNTGNTVDLESKLVNDLLRAAAEGRDRNRRRIDSRWPSGRESRSRSRDETLVRLLLELLRQLQATTTTTSTPTQPTTTTTTTPASTTTTTTALRPGNFSGPDEGPAARAAAGAEGTESAAEQRRQQRLRHAARQILRQRMRSQKERRDTVHEIARQLRGLFATPLAASRQSFEQQQQPSPLLSPEQLFAEQQTSLEKQQEPLLSQEQQGPLLSQEQQEPLQQDALGEQRKLLSQQKQQTSLEAQQLRLDQRSARYPQQLLSQQGDFFGEQQQAELSRNQQRAVLSQPNFGTSAQQNETNFFSSNLRRKRFAEQQSEQQWGQEPQNTEHRQVQKKQQRDEPYKQQYEQQWNELYRQQAQQQQLEQQLSEHPITTSVDTDGTEKLDLNGNNGNAAVVAAAQNAPNVRDYPTVERSDPAKESPLNGLEDESPLRFDADAAPFGFPAALPPNVFGSSRTPALLEERERYGYGYGNDDTIDPNDRLKNYGNDRRQIGPVTYSNDGSYEQTDPSYGFPLVDEAYGIESATVPSPENNTVTIPYESHYYGSDATKRRYFSEELPYNNNQYDDYDSSGGEEPDPLEEYLQRYQEQYQRSYEADDEPGLPYDLLAAGARPLIRGDANGGGRGAAAFSDSLLDDLDEAFGGRRRRRKFDGVLRDKQGVRFDKSELDIEKAIQQIEKEYGMPKSKRRDAAKKRKDSAEKRAKSSSESAEASAAQNKRPHAKMSDKSAAAEILSREREITSELKEILADLKKLKHQRYPDAEDRDNEDLRTFLRQQQRRRVAKAPPARPPATSRRRKLLLLRNSQDEFEDDNEVDNDSADIVDDYDGEDLSSEIEAAKIRRRRVQAPPPRRRVLLVENKRRPAAAAATIVYRQPPASTRYILDRAPTAAPAPQRLVLREYNPTVAGVPTTIIRAPAAAPGGSGGSAGTTVITEPIAFGPRSPPTNFGDAAGSGRPPGVTQMATLVASPRVSPASSGPLSTTGGFAHIDVGAGFGPIPPELCKDYYPYCEQITPSGFCSSTFYPLKMKREFCPQSCGLC